MQVLSPHQLELSLLRLAHQLAEEMSDANDTVIIGLQPRGIYISDKIVEQLKKLLNRNIQYGKLDITFYRDDFRKELHAANATDIPFSIDNKKVILIDDVLYTGRTIRAALDALTDFGRPVSVKLCVLVNRRFERELPIQPDYCGMTIDSVHSQKVRVNKETGDVSME
jgi:pyrimidine operon attenuation protein/uracil phosphoribosyltransferase